MYPAIPYFYLIPLHLFKAQDKKAEELKETLNVYDSSDEPSEVEDEGKQCNFL